MLDPNSFSTSFQPASELDNDFPTKAKELLPGKGYRNPFKEEATSSDRQLFRVTTLKGSEENRIKMFNRVSGAIY